MYKNFSKVYDKFMEICDYNEWVKLLEKYKLDFCPDGKNFLDLGCGTGSTLVILSEKYKCSGLDLSEEMLKRANIKLKGKNVPLFLGDMREFSTGEKYDIIFSFFDTVNHLSNTQDLLNLFNSVGNSLNEEGIYVFDVVDREFMDKMFANDIYADSRRDFAVIWEHFYNEEENLDEIEASYFVKNKNKTYDRYNEYYEKRIFTHEEICFCCEKAGLQVKITELNDQIAGKRYFYVLKKI